MWVVGENGRVRCSTIENGVGLDVSEREEYRRAAASGRFFVSDFFVSKLRNLPLAIATLPVRSQSGERLLLAITLDLSWFDRLSATMGERTTAAILLLDSKGTVLSRYPYDKTLIGRNFATHSTIQSMLKASDGRFEGTRLDGKQGFWGFVKLADTDLRLAVGFDRSAALANLNRGTKQAIAIFVFVSLTMGGLIWFAGNKYFANPMRELDELLKETLDNMDQGLIVVDKHGTLPICNKRALELLELPQHLMSSHPTAEAVIAYQTATGEFDNISDEVRSRLQPRVNGETRNIYERERPNGTVLEIRTVPFTSGGGVVRTFTDVTARKQFERMLESLANKDGLTGLSNRRQFDAALDAELARARRSGSRLALILIDIDQFKAFNDRYGHPGGDACLQSVANTVQANIRRPGDIAARYGGEEFAVILPNTDLDGGMLVAQQIRHAIAELRIEHLGADNAIVTISAGVTSVGQTDGCSAGEVVARADTALYKAKNGGRNRVERYVPHSEAQSAAA